MRIRSTRVPFSEIVGAEATELAFDPDTDYLVIRSMFAMPTSEVRDFAARLDGIGAETPEAEQDAILLELIGRTVTEWHLVGVDGRPVPQPVTSADLNALPGAVRGALFPFLASFRGRPDPTPAA